MADYTQLWNLLGGGYIDVKIFGITWLLGLILAVATTLIITRDKNAYPYLFLPTTIMWQIVGFRQSFVWYTVCTILFVVKLLSTDVIGNMVSPRIKEIVRELPMMKEKTRKEKLDEIAKEAWDNSVKDFAAKTIRSRKKGGGTTTYEELQQILRETIRKGKGGR